MADGRRFDLSVLFRVVDRVSKPLRRAALAFKRLRVPLSRAAAGLKRFGMMAATVGKRIHVMQMSLAKGLSSIIPMQLALPAMAALAIKSSVDFNKSMANVATLIPDNIKRIRELKVATKDMAGELGVSTDDLAGGLYQVVSAFGDADDTMEKLRVSAIAGRAGLASTTDSLNLLSIMTKEYGDSTAKDMQKSSDMAFKAVKLGQTTFADLAQSMSMVVPVAARLGVSQESLWGTMATFTRGGSTTARIVTQLSAIMMSFLKPSEAMKKAVDELGYSSATTMLRTLDLGGTMQLLNKYTKGDVDAMGELVPNMRAVRLAMAFTGKQMDVYTRKTKEMYDLNKDTLVAFKQQTDGINAAGEAWNKLFIAVKGVGQAFGDLFSGTGMVAVLKFLTGGVNKLAAGPAGAEGWFDSPLFPLAPGDVQKKIIDAKSAKLVNAAWQRERWSHGAKNLRGVLKGPFGGVGQRPWESKIDMTLDIKPVPGFAAELTKIVDKSVTGRGPRIHATVRTQTDTGRIIDIPLPEE